jgi:serine/threonine protein kinase
MTEIGKYEIIKVLGKGASSTVYLAYDPFSERQVAIKRLNLETLGEEEGKEFKKLFLTEASLAGKIQHPYITSIYDAVISPETCYLVMEYVVGGTLERYCQVDNLLPTDKVIEIIFKCSRALAYACRNGIIHRDIKPENILIVEGTDIKITDFGAALVMHDTPHDSHRPSAVGSLAYMSPQQAQAEELNQQADIYSLGIMFYKMLTGSLPFSTVDDAGLMFQICHVKPPNPSTFRLDIPQYLDDIVMRSIAKELADRYQNWEEFEQALTAAFVKFPREASSFSDTEKFNTLSKLSFFKDFSEIELWEVLHITKWAYYPEGTSIIREGDETASFFIIISGETEIRKNGRGICTLTEGECFGEMSGLRKNVRRRTASVYAHKDIKLIEVSEQALGMASENCQRRFDKAFLDILAGRLAAAGLQDKTRESARRKFQGAPPLNVQSDADNGAKSISHQEGSAPQVLAANADEINAVSSPNESGKLINIAGLKMSMPVFLFCVAFIVLIHFVSIPQIIRLIFRQP